MSEHGLRHALHMRIESADHLEPFVGDAHLDHAAIASASAPLHEAAACQAVDEPRDVGIAGDHAFRNVTAREFRRMAAAQDAKDVVLVRRQLRMRLQELRPGLDDSGGGDKDSEKDLVFL